MSKFERTHLNRRAFVRGALSLGSLAVLASRAHARSLALPPGLQLYSVRQQMAENLDSTFAAVAAAGFVEVEAAALPAKSSAGIRAALNKAALRCVGAHHPFADLSARFDEILAYDAELGAKYLICASPGRRPGSEARQPMTLDDWRYNAETFNTFGERAATHGMGFGYHNHIHEFDLIDGVSPYEELLRLTNPKKVTFELDCGWARVANHDPIQLMQQHPYRFSMLHVKDFHLGAASNPGRDAHVTELGRGDIDYKPVFAQARKNQRIQHEFVEQEGFDVPWQESLKIDADYMRRLTLG